jgi:hypothetical protein
MVSNERKGALNQLEGSLVAQSLDLQPGGGQKGLTGAGIIGCRIMFGLEYPVAIFEPLCCFQVQAAARAGQQGLKDRFVHHGVGKLEVLAIGHDQPAGNEAPGIKAAVIN